MTSELLLPAAFLAGFVGSTHCIGMCGAIVVLLEKSHAGSFAGWTHRVSYNLGRLGFYALLGAVAGGAGAMLTAAVGVKYGLLTLRLLAGLLVIAIGLNLLFDWRSTRFLEQAGAGIWQRLSPLARHVLPITTPAGATAAGFIWGALPCGLVYSAVAIAATSGNAVSGALVMLAFWLGTLPAILLAGASAETLNKWKTRRWFRRPAGAIMILIGMLAMLPLRMLG